MFALCFFFNAIAIAAAARNQQDIIVQFKQYEDLISPRPQTSLLVLELQRHMTSSQALVVAELSNLNYQQLWISNSLKIYHAPIELIRLIQRQENVIKINAMPATSRRLNWGIRAIHAEKAWKTGAKGEETIVGIIDTGIELNHSSFVENRLLNWFDSVQTREKPYDDHSHGTATTSLAISVAPKVNYVSCKALNDQNTFQSEWNVLECAQFILCPDFPHCTQTPRVVSNSWEFSSTDTTVFDAVIRIWTLAQIIPVFSAGNSESFQNCHDVRVHAPANHPQVITVGAVDRHLSIAPFSNRGMANGVHKPDFLAPGVKIKAASLRGHRKYKRQTGTSFAAPFVTGTIALMLSEAQKCNIQLSFDQVYQILTETSSVQGLKPPSVECRSSNGTDLAFGRGLIQVHAAVQATRRRFC